MTTLYTIGYERLLPEPLAAELSAAGVRRLIDVRFRPQSRRPGMSKTRLGAFLAERGIAYEHRRELGTPPNIRIDFKQLRIPEGRRAFRAYLTSEQPGALERLAAELDDPATPATALLCLEDDPATCHRRVIAELLLQRLPGLAVVDL